MAETSQSKSDRPEIVKHAARINPISPAPIRTAGFIVAMPVNAAKAAKMMSVCARSVEQKIRDRHHFSAE